MNPWIVSRALVGALLISTASAQLTPVGPFGGDLQDGFEGPPTGPVSCLEDGVFGGQAIACSNFAVERMGPGQFVPSFVPRTGESMLFGFGQIDLVFESPVRRLGGWVLSPSMSEGFIAAWSPDGTFLGSEKLRVEACSRGCNWRWNGFEAPAGQSIGQVLMYTQTAIGGNLGLDDWVVDLDCSSPANYCTAKTNGLGCTPSVQAPVGSSCPISGGGDYSLTVSPLLNQVLAILFYGDSPANLPFQGGTLCIGGALHRTTPTFTGGSLPPLDCSGSLVHTINDPAGLDFPSGSVVYFQAWSRDPLDPTGFGTSLSDGIRVTYR